MSTKPRPPHRPVVRHARAPVYATIAVTYHTYVTTFTLAHAALIKSVVITWIYPDVQHGVLSIAKMSLLDGAGQRAYPVTGELLFASDTARWRRVANTVPDAVFENLHPHPRAWIVHDVVPSTADSALSAVHNGTEQPRVRALIENGPALHTTPGVRESATITDLQPAQMTVRTNCGSACFLLTSDTFYRGWAASIDGAPAQLYRADYALRGVFVPAGLHEVHFVYWPQTMIVGAGISLAALFAIGALFVPLVRKRLALAP